MIVFDDLFIPPTRGNLLLVICERIDFFLITGSKKFFFTFRDVYSISAPKLSGLQIVGDSPVR